MTDYITKINEPHDTAYRTMQELPIDIEDLREVSNKARAKAQLANSKNLDILIKDCKQIIFKEAEKGNFNCLYEGPNWFDRWFLGIKWDTATSFCLRDRLIAMGFDVVQQSNYRYVTISWAKSKLTIEKPKDPRLMDRPNPNYSPKSTYVTRFDP